MGEKRKMVGGVTFFPAQLYNFRILDPDRRRDKNIINPETEKMSTKPVKSSHFSLIWVSHPENVH